MLVRELPLAASRVAVDATLADDLVASLGEERFAQRVVTALGRCIRLAHLSAFSFGGVGAPRLIGTGSLTSPQGRSCLYTCVGGRVLLCGPTSARLVSRTRPGPRCRRRKPAYSARTRRRRQKMANG